MCVLFIYGLKGYAFMPATCEACNVRPNMQCLKVTSLFSSTAENFKHVFTLTHMPLLSKSYICVYVLKTIKTLPLSGFQLRRKKNPDTKRRQLSGSEIIQQCFWINISSLHFLKSYWEKALNSVMDHDCTSEITLFIRIISDNSIIYI